MYEMREDVFKYGCKCRFFYIVMQGVVEINITNGKQNVPLDLLGRGSVMGLNYMINEDELIYNA
jgi:signal-transduction protein with cAMP-binding, CBS, and nucleotidyltransferase domain